jgi:NitT/TauT family transport system ATP-binding protein
VTAAAARSVIEVTDVSKVYVDHGGEPIRALDLVSFTIDEGEFVSVVGPSGCGKSTLLQIIAGLIPVSTGIASLLGTRIIGPRKDIGVVFQQPVLLPWRTVFRNVLVPVELQGLHREPRYRERCEALLELVGLRDFAERYPQQLSGGMQQRVGLARALIHDPALLLMDEPFGALDALTREQMNRELLSIWAASRKTVFFITHSVPEAVFLSDRVLVLSQRPARLLGEVVVELPRPRRLDMMASPGAGAASARIRELLETSGALD